MLYSSFNACYYFFAHPYGYFLFGSFRTGIYLLRLSSNFVLKNKLHSLNYYYAHAPAGHSPNNEALKVDRA